MKRMMFVFVVAYATGAQSMMMSRVTRCAAAAAMGARASEQMAAVRAARVARGEPAYTKGEKAFGVAVAGAATFGAGWAVGEHAGYTRAQQERE